MLALVGEETHLLGLLLEHATQESTFLIEAASWVLEGLAGSTALAVYELHHLLNVQT